MPSRGRAAWWPGLPSPHSRRSAPPACHSLGRAACIRRRRPRPAATRTKRTAPAAISPILSGGNAPQLAGPTFKSGWGHRTPRELAAVIQASMPPGGPAVDLDTAVTLTAYILERNGVPAGSTPLTADTAAMIGSVATGSVPARDGSPPPAQSGAPAASGPRMARQPAAPSRPSVTFPGEVQGFTPVTDAMLHKPDPADWLMIRGNYQAWSHSPLTSISRATLPKLKLAWVWAMHETGGASQPSPIAHHGTLYLWSPGNIVQALDGRTGDLIWESRVGPPDASGGGTTGAVRNLAIYDTLLIVGTTDARMVALDARTGKLVWQAVVADRKKGYAIGTSPLVINGTLCRG